MCVCRSLIMHYVVVVAAVAVAVAVVVALVCIPPFVSDNIQGGVITGVGDKMLTKCSNLIRDFAS